MIKELNENIKLVEIFNEDNHEHPFVISIPHSGEFITKSMKDKFVDNVKFTNIDWYLPEVYDFLQKMGLTIIINNVSRYVIDPNRSINVTSDNDDYKNNYIYKKTTFGKEMYKKDITQKEEDERISKYYKYYHKCINNALLEKTKYFDKVFLIDIHSFAKDLCTDIVLGNDNGKTSSSLFFGKLKKLLQDEGFSVSDNKPYSGGFITKHYGNSITNCESVQIELSYKKYIEDRDFVEEDFPIIDYNLLNCTRNKLKKVFEKLL